MSSDTFKGRVLVYTVLGCPYCMKAKATLNRLGLPCTEVRLDVFPYIREEVIKMSGMRTVPQIYFNETLVGGNDDLNNLVQDREKLEELLLQVRNVPFSKEVLIIPEAGSAIVSTIGDWTCETDEYVSLTDELKSCSLAGTQRVGLRLYRNAFSGTGFLSWIKENKGLDDAVAVEMGQTLLDRQLIDSVNKSKIFVPSSEIYVFASGNASDALNGGSLSSCVPKTATELGKHLHTMILKLYEEFLKDDGKSVDYAGIKNSENFQVYKKMTKELARVNIESSSREEKLAFFINIYNTLVIHATVEKGPPHNLWSRYKFFNDSKYIIGGCVYSLQDIENGVLRANRKGPGQLSRPFGKNDPRLLVALDRHEPLVHFALVCGAKSCPPIKTYTPERIYEELQLVTSAFLESDSGCQLDLVHNTIKLSSIFKWYQIDFGQDKAQLIDFVLSHMQSESKVRDLKSIVDGGTFTISFLPYDWTSNSRNL